ncbi:hypothetical protein HDU99_009908 [Rhizoclosmatium hyalinum]|nr:hypothetical protein HDU99_009908 [Rhizoclosmatium hyalinum]
MVRLVHSSCPEFRGATIDIGIRINESTVNTPEYPFDDGSTDKCYVESQLDKQYIIDFYITNNNRLSDPDYRLFPGCVYLQAEVNVDGKCMSCLILTQKGRSRVLGKTDASCTRPFVFSAPTLVRDGGLLEKKDVDQLGTIQVKVWPIKLGNQTTFMGEASHTASPINEKAKKGVFISATTKLGAPDPTFVPKYCNSIKQTNEPLLIHTFHYKTREFLEVEGIIPEAPSAPLTRNIVNAPSSSVAPIIPNIQPEPVKVRSIIPEPPSVPAIPNILPVKPEPTSSTQPLVKSEIKSNATVPFIREKRTAPELESEEVEFVRQVVPKKKKTVEVIDLTLE